MARFAFVSVLLFLCTLVAHVESLRAISSVEDFKEFAQSAKDGTHSFPGGAKLEVDIDLTDLSILPIGLRDDGGCNAFRGTFDGNNKTISGAAVENTNYAGFFCRLEGDALVTDLHLDSTCKFVGWRVGAVSASMGSGTLLRVSSEARVVGDAGNGGGGEIGGLIGSVTNLPVAGMAGIESCTSNGTIEYIGDWTQGEPKIGGLIGEVEKNSLSAKVGVTSSLSSVLFPSNLNGSIVGGMIGSITDNSIVTLTVNNFTSSGNITVDGGNVVNAGGMVGEVSTNGIFTASIGNSTNHASISALSSYPTVFLGGFFGSITKCNVTSVTIDNCTNNGDIINTEGNEEFTYLGGFVGAVHLGKTSQTTVFTISNTVNRGNLTATNGVVCGFLCQSTKGSSPSVFVRNSINRGSIVGREAFGIIGTTDRNSNITNVVNLGTVSGTAASNCLWKTTPLSSSVFVMTGVCNKDLFFSRAFERWAVPHCGHKEGGCAGAAEQGGRGRALPNGVDQRPRARCAVHRDGDGPGEREHRRSAEGAAEHPADAELVLHHAPCGHGH